MYLICTHSDDSPIIKISVVIILIAIITSKIANHFKTKFSGFYSSVPTSEETVDAIAKNIDIDIQKYCTSKVNRYKNYVHCHVISRDDVRDAVSKLKSSKIDEDGHFYSESIIHCTGLLFEYISKLLSQMICHRYVPTSFIKSSIIPIPKGVSANLTDSHKYRSIAISSLLSKLLDYVIIEKQNMSLKTLDYQFGFKPEFSTILCTTMVKETIQYYSENRGKPVHLLLLDARKAFDKVAYDMLFNVLIEKNVCSKIVRLLLRYIRGRFSRWQPT